MVRTRRTLAALAALVFLLTATLPLTAFAADTAGDGPRNSLHALGVREDDSYETVQIQGIRYAYNDEVAWVDNNRYSKEMGSELQIASQVEGRPVVYISDHAFGDGVYPTPVTRVTIPGTVRIIGRDAFRGNQQLESVVIQEGVESIGDNAFAGTRVNNPAIPGSLTDLGIDVFGNTFINRMYVADAGRTECVWPFADLTFGGTKEQWHALISTTDELAAYYSPISVSCLDGVVSPDWQYELDNSWCVKDNFKAAYYMEADADHPYPSYDMEVTVQCRQGNLTAHLTTRDPALPLMASADAPPPHENVTLHEGNFAEFFYAVDQRYVGSGVYIEGTIEINGVTQEFHKQISGGAPEAMLPSWISTAIVTPSVAEEGKVETVVALEGDGWMAGWLYLLDREGRAIGKAECDPFRGYDPEMEEDDPSDVLSPQIQIETPYTGLATLVYYGPVGTEWDYAHSLMPAWYTSPLVMATIGTVGVGVPAPDSPGDESVLVPKPDSGIHVTGTGENRFVEGITIAAPGQTPPTVEALLIDFDVPQGYTITVRSQDGAEVSPTTAVGTGLILKVTGPDGQTAESATVVIPGDVLGTGQMSLSQLVRTASAFAGVNPLTGPFLKAAQLSGSDSDKVSLTDLVQMARLLTNLW